jgi:hypothetical protein
MERFEYRGKKLEVWTQSGTVVSASKLSRTFVSSHGGGGWVGPHGGPVSAPTVSSSTTTEQEIWIRRANGEETAIQFSGKNVPVREGQRLTFIAAKRPQAKDGFWVTLVNHAANRHWRLSNNAEISARGLLGAYPLLTLSDLAAAVFILILMLLTAFLSWNGRPPTDPDLADLAPFRISGLFLIPLFYVPVKVWLRVKQKDLIFAALDSWAERNAQVAYALESAETSAP